MLESNMRLYKKAGGTIIHQKPVFSCDSRILFIGYGPILRSFSTSTGEHIQDYEIDADLSTVTPRGNIIDIVTHPFKKNAILCCFEKGSVITWSYEVNEILNNYDLCIKDRKVIVAMKVITLPNQLEVYDLVVAVKDRPAFPKAKLKFYSGKDGTLKYSCDKLFKFSAHSWSVTGVDGMGFAAFINYNRLTVINTCMYKCNNDIIIGNERYYTCVACHPTQECVAAGDNTGRVLLYYKFLEPSSGRSPFNVFHWHTLPVNDIAFTGFGSHFYTGGNEHVLVKWTCEATDVRTFLPRLSAPIVHVTVSPSNEMIAVSTLDNGISIVSPQLYVTCCIQEFTWGFISMPDQKLFPCGLNVDLRSNCIVTNGRPGHIQFYSPQYSTLVYNMDVCDENYVSHERNEKIPNSEVVAIQFSPDGTWLATSQIRHDPKFSSDTLIKFWQFDRKSQLYKLKTNVTSYYEVSKILFQPLDETGVDGGVSKPPEYAVATLCGDNKFRIWMETSHVFGPKKKCASWNCSSIGYYRDHQLSDICFSNDGSILGAAFGPCLTLWDTETNTMKSCLVKDNKPIRKIVFGHDDCSFVAVSVTEDKITAWNLLSLTVLWYASLNTSLIIPDPCSGHVAVFTDQNSLFVFKLTSSVAVYKRDQLCDKDTGILSAVFFPVNNDRIKSRCSSSSSSSVSWLQNSSLYFFTSKQELMVFEVKSNTEPDKRLPMKNEVSIGTHFGGYLASKIASDVKKPSVNDNLQLTSPWIPVLSEFLEPPAHTMPPVHLMCESILRSFLLKRYVES